MNLRKINWFLLFKLPSAWFCGVRAKQLSNAFCKVTVKHSWINQNPFKSMYFAVQNMAAELSTGVLVMQAINDNDLPVSMLVIESNSRFYKKATGVISFECFDGKLAQKAVEESIKHDTSKEILMSVKAYNSNKVIVSEFSFKWSLRPKTKS